LRNDPVKKIGTVLAAAAVFITVVLLIYFAFLNEGRLETVDFVWVDNHPASGFPYVHLEGTVFNSGSSGAKGVQLVTTIYGSGGTLLRTNVTDLGDIPAGGQKKISLDIQYGGKADKCEVTLRWKPFGG
jgi:hypothetical protein